MQRRGLGCQMPCSIAAPLPRPTARNLRSSQSTYISCLHTQCNLVGSTTDSQGRGISGAKLLDTTGIRAHGTLHTSVPGDWAFACFHGPQPGVAVAQVGSTIPTVITTSSGSMQCVATCPLYCDDRCCKTHGFPSPAT